MRKFILFSLLALLPFSSLAFELLYPVTIENKTWRYAVALPGATVEGTPYMDLFDHSVKEWNHQANLNLSWKSRIRGDGPCDDLEGVNNFVAAIDADICGDNPFPYAAGASTIAYLNHFKWSNGVWQPRDSTLNANQSPFITTATIFMSTRNGTYDSDREFNASSTLTHEIGHNLGLDHSTIRNSLMSQSGSEPFNHDDFDGLPTLDHDSLCGVFFLNDEHDRCSTWRPAAITDGSRTWAEFHSYASHNGGHAERSVFDPAEELDAYGTIVISPPDWDKPGAIHVVAMHADGSLSFRLENGQWTTDWTGGRLPIAYRQESFNYAHDFQIAGLNYYRSHLENEAYELGLTNIFDIIDHFDIPIQGLWFANAIDRSPAAANAAWDYVWHYLRSEDPDYASGEKWGFGDGDSIAFYIAYSTDDAPDVYHYSAEPLIITWSATSD